MVAKFIYLFASPLTKKEGSDLVESTQEVEALNVRKEWDELRYLFHSSNVSVSMAVACRKEITKLLSVSSTPLQKDSHDSDVIHFTCHGSPNGLVLEDGTGNLDMLKTQELKEMLCEDRGRIKLVFVSACSSEETGRVFVEAGVPHVVAVKRDVKVADEVSNRFASSFYGQLLAGTTVSEAFQFAHNIIQLTPGKDEEWRERQKQKFMLLPNDGTVDHNVPVFHIAQERLDDSFSSDHLQNPVNYCPQVSTKFVGRRILMQAVVETLVGERDPQRWITLHGVKGIGKTSCAVAVCKFICERHHCKSAYFVPLQKHPESAKTAELLRDDLVKALRVNAPGGSGITSYKHEEDVFKAIHAFASSLPFDGPLIIVLDGFDEWAGEDKFGAAAQIFKEFIADLLKASPFVSVLCTSSRPILSREIYSGVVGPKCCAEKGFQVGPLTNLQAAELLEKLAHNNISELDLVNVALDSANERPIERLARHPVVELCRGHPSVVRTVAEKLRVRKLSDLEDDARSAASLAFGESKPNSPSSASPPTSSSSSSTFSSGVNLSSIMSRDPSAWSRTASNHPSSSASLSPASNNSARRVESEETERRRHANASFALIPPLPPSDIPSTSILVSQQVTWRRGDLIRIIDKLSVSLSSHQTSDLWNLVSSDVREVISNEWCAQSNALKRTFTENDVLRMRTILLRKGQPKSMQEAADTLVSFWKWLEGTINMLVVFHQYWNHSIIYGLISKDDANKILGSNPAGCFLIRVSESCGGLLAFAISQGDGRVLHSLISPVRNSAAQMSARVKVSTNSGTKEYASLKDFILTFNYLTTLWTGQEKFAALKLVNSVF